MFHVGQKVEYIGPKLTEAEEEEVGFALPKHGVPYTVTNVYSWFGEQLIELLELPQPGNELAYPGFFARVFRPIVERKTDISVFTEMLNRASELV